MSLERAPRRRTWWLTLIGAVAVLTRALISLVGYFASKPSLRDVLMTTIFGLAVVAGMVGFIVALVGLEHAGVRRVTRRCPDAYVRTVADRRARNYILFVDQDRVALLSLYRGRSVQEWPRHDIRSVTVAPIQVVRWNRPRPVMRPGITIRFAHGGDPLPLVVLTRYLLALSKKTADAAAVQHALTNSTSQRTG